MSFEALQSYKVKLQLGRYSIFCWALLILIILPITFMFSQSHFLTQIPFFLPSETQPANCRNRIGGFLPKSSWLLPSHTTIPTHFQFHLCSWISCLSHITTPHPNLYTETAASLSHTSSKPFLFLLSSLFLCVPDFILPIYPQFTLICS